MHALRQFIRDSVRGAGLPLSGAACELLVMIAAHESGGFRWVQQDGGPALGLWQMEPIGYREVQRYVGVRSERFEEDIIRSLERPFEDLNFDQAWSCQCARIFLMAEPEPLPQEDDISGLAEYAKRHWNTEAGSATAEDYRLAYEVYGG